MYMASPTVGALAALITRLPAKSPASGVIKTSIDTQEPSVVVVVAPALVPAVKPVAVIVIAPPSQLVGINIIALNIYLTAASPRVTAKVARVRLSAYVTLADLVPIIA